MKKRKGKPQDCWLKPRPKVAVAAVVADPLVAAVVDKDAVHPVVAVVAADPVVTADPVEDADSSVFRNFILTFKYSNNYVNCCYYSR